MQCNCDPRTWCLQCMFSLKVFRPCATLSACPHPAHGFQFGARSLGLSPGGWLCAFSSAAICAGLGARALHLGAPAPRGLGAAPLEDPGPVVLGRLCRNFEKLRSLCLVSCCCPFGFLSWLTVPRHFVVCLSLISILKPKRGPAQCGSCVCMSYDNLPL